jgi:hypothetical protein
MRRRMTQGAVGPNPLKRSRRFGSKTSILVGEILICVAGRVAVLYTVAHSTHTHGKQQKKGKWPNELLA